MRVGPEAIPTSWHHHPMPWLSKSAHPKAIGKAERKAARGSTTAAVADRDGKPTKITTRPSRCVAEGCGRFLSPGEGWLITVPSGGAGGKVHAAMCREGCLSSGGSG